MTNYGYGYEPEDPFAEPAPKKKSRPRPKRCTICRANVEPDGYGEWVHSGTEEWPATYYGCQYFHENGDPAFIRPTDPRFVNVARV